MPIYEYEPVDRECFICNGRVEFMQNVSEGPLEYCPTCGLEVRRIVSRASIQIRPGSDPDKAAKRGFTTFKRVEKGKWERIGGEGPDMIVGKKEDVEAVETESKPPKKVLDLDSH